MRHIAARREPSWLLLAAFLLLGCTEEPYETRAPGDARDVARVELGVAERSSDGPDPLAGTTVLSICYGRPLNDRNELLAEAALMCPYNGQVRFIEQNTFWNGCSVAQPVRATFLCWPGEPPPSPYQ